jgi:hypothetical protein
VGKTSRVSEPPSYIRRPYDKTRNPNPEARSPKPEPRNPDHPSRVSPVSKLALLFLVRQLVLGPQPEYHMGFRV